jgi:hypothetical protein
VSKSIRKGELRRLIKEFVALEEADEISVGDISSFLIKKHSKLVEIEKVRLFHNSIADIARSVLKTPQASQQLLLPGFPEDAYLPARVPIKSKAKNGQPVWKKPIKMNGPEIQSRILELNKPVTVNRELNAMKFMMSGLKSKLGEKEGPQTQSSYAEVMGLDESKKKPGDP